MSDKPKPKGSGAFSFLVGLLAAGAGYWVSQFGFEIENITPRELLTAWLYFVAAILIYWGIRRLFTGKGRWFVVGQPTFNFVIGLIAATFALLALFVSGH